ncbi:MAG: RIP metalloprotease RseP [Muribaculaceae bacterium]|nr:RIP metalloprotease RseP [Muribaculaceae bacterium]
METFFIKAVQLIASLAFLVIIHEFGHYIIARAFGIKVEKFYLFFNPWFSIFKWKPKPAATPKLDKNGKPKATWRDTEYGIGWLPLGGYVKIAGMIDESMDKEQMKQPEQPWEFRSRPAYQRLSVMLAGVVFNFILAILIYAGIAFYWGKQYTPLETAYEGMDFSHAAQDAGFRDGDVILEADGQRVDMSDNTALYHIADAKTVKVLRDSKDTICITLPSDFILKINNDEGFMQYRLPVFIDRVQGGSAASEAGLESGDRIVAVGGFPTPSYTELTKHLQEAKDRDVLLTIERDGKELELTAHPSADGKLGFNLKPLSEVYPSERLRYSFFAAFPAGWELGTSTLGAYVSSMRHVFSVEGAKSIGGFGAIGGMFPDRWNWLSFWEITAFLSVVLAFMNIIPIPGLDGGHALFVIIEIIIRRKPSEKIIEYSQYAGMMFLLLLLVYANGADIVRAILN